MSRKYESIQSFNGLGYNTSLTNAHKEEVFVKRRVIEAFIKYTYAYQSEKENFSPNSNISQSQMIDKEKIEKPYLSESAYNIC